MGEQESLGFEPSKEARTVELTLPWPPSANHYRGIQVILPKTIDMKEYLGSNGWKGFYKFVQAHSRPHFFLTDDAEGFHNEVKAIAWQEGCQKLSGPLKLTVVAYPPDRRRRDLSNLMKMTEDALQAAGLYDDDFQIEREDLWRRTQVVKGGKLEIKIEELV